MAILSCDVENTFISAANSMTPPQVLSYAAGDLGFLIVAGKPFNASISISDSGTWNSLGRTDNGSTAAGNDSGSMFIEPFWKELDGTEAPDVVEGATTWNICTAGLAVLTKDASDTWDTPVLVGGGDTTSGTGFSVTAGSNPGIVTGDHCITIAAFQTDAATPCSSHITPTATGVTFTNTHDPATDPETTTGGDMGMCVTRSTVSGTASAAPVLAATLAGAATGTAVLVRFRTTAAPPAALVTPQPGIDFGSTAVLMGGLRRAWHRRRSGIFVPELWLPA